MTDADVTNKVEAWRLENLLDAGYPIAVAEILAARPAHQLDLHHAVRLLEHGCPAELAAKILL